MARADPLSGRISAAKSRQADLQRALARQQQLLSQLQTDSQVAHTALDSTSQGLDGINADQAAIKKEIAAASDALASQQRRHDALTQQLSQLDYTLGLLESEIDAGLGRAPGTPPHAGPASCRGLPLAEDQPARAGLHLRFVHRRADAGVGVPRLWRPGRAAGQRHQ